MVDTGAPPKLITLHVLMVSAARGSLFAHFGVVFLATFDHSMLIALFQDEARDHGNESQARERRKDEGVEDEENVP